MVSIIERPYKCSWSKNEIRYVFELDNIERVNLRLQVKLSFAPVALEPAPVELFTFLLHPDAKGKVYLYMQEYLHSVVSHVLPSEDTGSLFTNADSQMVYYSIEYRELSDGVETPLYDSSEADYTRNNYRLYALLGGIERHRHSRNNFFNRFNDNPFFFTWQPSDRMIDRTETCFLSFLNPSFGNTEYKNDYSIRLTMQDVQGNLHTADYPLDKLCLFYHVRFDLAELDKGPLFQSQMYSLLVELINDSNASICHYRFFYEFRPVYSFYDLMYHNSLGGLDFVRVKGEVDETAERFVEEANSGFDINSWESAVSSGETQYSFLSLQKKYKGDIGYLRNKNAQNAYLEMLLSPSLWQRIGFRWVQVLVIQKSAELGARRSSLNSFPLEWSLAETNEVYTPEDFFLPKGNTN